MEFFCLHMGREYPEPEKDIAAHPDRHRSLRMLSSVCTFIYRFLDIPSNTISNRESRNFTEMYS